MHSDHIFYDECSRYIKPHKRPEPPVVTEPLQTSPELANKAEKRDLSWKLVRLSSQKSQDVPTWSAFNAYTTERSCPVAVVRYLPFLRSSPSNLSTIYTVLLKLAQIAEKVGQEHILVTADLAIYSKAQEILWNKPPVNYSQPVMLSQVVTVTAACTGLEKRLPSPGWRRIHLH